MAQTIKLKRSATPSAIPTTSNLELGELALNTNDGAIYIKRDDGSSPDDILAVHHEPTMHIDYTNNRIGIGTSNPGQKLEIKESSTGAGDAIIRLRGNGNNANSTPLGSLEWWNADSSGAQPGVVAAVEAQSANANGHMGKLLFKTHDGSGSEADPPTTRMTIDESGNVLVGKTSTGAATAGIELNGVNDILRIARDGGVLQELNRITSNGDIIEFRKDNSPVGSIGVDSGDNLYISASAANHAGIYFSDVGISAMQAGSLIDASVDLGTSSYRFKDLYLSGTATMGGLEIGDGSAGGTSEILFSDNVSARGKIVCCCRLLVQLEYQLTTPKTSVFQTVMSVSARLLQTICCT
jgi:hypothetical protein